MKDQVIVFAVTAGSVVLLLMGCRSEPAHGGNPEKPGIEMLQWGTWTLIKLNDQDVPAEAKITLELQKDGKLAGSTGVNRYFGSFWSESPGRINFGALGSTRRAGPPDAMKRESDFLTAIQRVSEYRIKDQTMEMRDGQTMILVWRR